MKKLLLILFTVMGFAYAGAQSTFPADSLAITINKRCPVNFNDGMTLQQVSIEDGNFVFDYNISDDLYGNVEKLGGILHDSLVDEMTTSPDENIKKLIALCRNKKIDILHRYSNSAKYNFIITITPDDLQ